MLLKQLRPKLRLDNRLQVKYLNVWFFNQVSFFVGSATQQPQAQGNQPSQAADIQAQWAEYYRSLGYPYYGQQSAAPSASGQPPQPPTATSNGDQKVAKSTDA